MLPLNHRRTRSQSVWWIAGVCCLCVLSVSYSSNTPYCGPPCTARMCVNTSRTCLYGTFLVCGGCCYECLAGPGEWCKAFAPECGHGLRCVGALTEGPRSLHTPGRCQRIENSTTTTPSVGTAGKRSLCLVHVCLCVRVCVKLYSCIAYRPWNTRRSA